MPGPLRYQEPQLQDRLASSYVIGTMRGKARTRFEAIMRDNEPLAKRVRQWEEKLQPVHQATRPVPPKKTTWERIAGAISKTSDHMVEQLMSKLRFYKYLSALAFSLAFVIGIASWSTLPTADTPAGINYVAVLEDNSDQAVMVATLTKADRALSLNLLQKPQVPKNGTLQLWAVSREDGSVSSLGLVELAERVEWNLTKPEWGLIKNAEYLVVSVENKGGSTSGMPSEQLVAKGLCVKVEGWQGSAG